MSAQLLYGHRPAADYAGVTTTLEPAGEDLLLPDVQIHYALFELPMAAALDCLPPGLHPAIPAHLGYTFWRCDEGPWGAFECAWVGLACRTGIKPRHLVYGAFASNAVVAAELRRRYGFACQLAEVHYRESYDRLHAKISVAGTTLLEVATTRLQAIVGAGATVKYSPALTTVVLDASTTLVQMEASYSFKRVLRGTPQVLSVNTAALGETRLVPGFPMSGTHALADVVLHAPRFKADLVVPAEQGGARKSS